MNAEVELGSRDRFGGQLEIDHMIGADEMAARVAACRTGIFKGEAKRPKPYVKRVRVADRTVRA